MGLLKNGQRKQRRTKTCSKATNNKPKRSRSSLPDLDCVDGETEQDADRRTSSVSMFAEIKQRPLDGFYEDFTEHEAIFPPASKNDCPEADMDDDCDIINVTDHRVSEASELITRSGEDVELQAMFYLPKWDSKLPLPSTELLSGKDESLKVILANVAELLSRSPPSSIEDLHADVATASPPPSPLQHEQTFKVSFTLDVDDDDDDEEVISEAGRASPRPDMCEPPVDKEVSEICQELQPVRTAADSPTWDEVFGNEDVNNDIDIRDVGECVGDQAEQNKDVKMDVRKEEVAGLTVCQRSMMDQSMDLFEDDEAFLQMTIPDISTPGRPSASVGEMPSSTKTMFNTSQIHNSANSVDRGCNTPTAARRLAVKEVTAQQSPTVQDNDSSHHFSLNFDLGYSLEDSEDEAEVEAVSVPCMLTSPMKPLKQADSTLSLLAASNLLTPYNSDNRQRVPLRCSNSKQSTPHMLSEDRKRETSSFLTSTFISISREVPSPITSAGARRMLMPGPASPHTPHLLSSSMRKRTEEGRSAADTKSHQESVCLSDSPLRKGLFSLQIMIPKSENSFGSLWFALKEFPLWLLFLRGVQQ